MVISHCCIPPISTLPSKVNFSLCYSLQLIFPSFNKKTLFLENDFSLLMGLLHRMHCKREQSCAGRYLRYSMSSQHHIIEKFKENIYLDKTVLRSAAEIMAIRKLQILHFGTLKNCFKYKLYNPCCKSASDLSV